MKTYRYAAYAALCLVLSSCASMGLTQPKSLPERIAYGYSVYTAVQTAAANSVTAGELSSADGEEVLKLADQSRTLLDAAKAISTTDPTGAATKLDLALAILTQLQTYMRSKS